MSDTMRPVRFDTDERIRFRAGAQTADEICLVGGLNELPQFEPYNRVYSYKPGRAEPWLYLDVDAYIVDVVSGRFEAGGPEFFALASSEGEIWVLGAPGTGFSEIIPGAGDLYEGALYGDIQCLRWIGDALYAVGNKCQVHRRVGRFGTWELISANILGDPFFAEGIAGREGDLYIYRRPVPDHPDYKPTDRRGQILHSSGGDWRIVWDGLEAVSAGPAMLPNGDVAIGGLHGTIIAGNHRDGFSVVSRGGQGWPGIVDVAALGNEIFATPGKLTRRRGTHTVVVDTGLKPDQESSIYLSVRGDSLLSVSYHDILRHAGGAWERVHFPGNSPVLPDTDWQRW